MLNGNSDLASIIRLMHILENWMKVGRRMRFGKTDNEMNGRRRVDGENERALDIKMGKDTWMSWLYIRTYKEGTVLRRRCRRVYLLRQMEHGAHASMMTVVLVKE